jgi:hypothetical protein
MKRAEFEHAVRAAAAVLGVEEILVIGSQALHGSVAGDLKEFEKKNQRLKRAVADLTLDNLALKEAF